MTEAKVLIERRLDSLYAEQKEAKTQKEMLVDSLANDGELVELEEKLKEARKRYAMQKEAILNEPENKRILDKLKDTNQSIKELKKLLSDELVGYVMGEKTLELQTSAGKIHRISLTGKITETDQPSLPFGGENA